VLLFVSVDTALAADNVAAVDLGGLGGITTRVVDGVFLGFLARIVPSEVLGARSMRVGEG
jgi:hypothetical protein